MLIFCVADIEFLTKDKFVQIKDFRIDKDHTVYLIEVSIGSYNWTVERRYSDFLEFDRIRFKHLKQSFLPPKKFLGNQDADFIKKRRAELERYLHTVFDLEILLQKKRHHSSIPRLLARFLDFHKYEVHAVCEELAHDLFHNGDKILSSCDYYELNPVHLHAITERLKLSVPTCESNNSTLDFGHILDFAHRLENLKIKGLKRSFENSNIIPNELQFSLNAFKSLKSLWITDCDPSMIYGILPARRTVSQLTVHNCVRFISDLVVDKDACACDFTNNHQSDLWTCILNVDFSFNNLNFIDESVILLKTVEKLNLTCNRLNGIEHLYHLTRLTELNLSHNLIESVDNWHQKLGNLKKLILTANKISCLEGLRKMYALEYLDLRDNRIVQTNDAWPVGGLPCLLVILLSGNPLEASVEYRSRVLEAFGDRAADVRLDNEPTTQRELDTVGVRLAIRKAREDRERQLKIARDQISQALNFGTKRPDDSSFGGSSLSGKSTASESYASDNENVT